MVERGEIYYVDWPSGRGAEEAGTRPARIIQNDVGNQFSSTTTVTAISTSRRTSYPFQIYVESSESGLPRDSVVKCERIQTIDQSRLGRLVGDLSDKKLAEVDVALHCSLGLEF